MTYSQIQSDHIREAGYTRFRTPRAFAIAPACHAIVFGHVEQTGTSIFGPEFDRANLKAKAIEEAKAYRDEQRKKPFGFVWIFVADWLIVDVIGRLVDIAIDWIIKQMTDWINRNKATAGLPLSQMRGVLADLKPVFYAARMVVQ